MKAKPKSEVPFVACQLCCQSTFISSDEIENLTRVDKIPTLDEVSQIVSHNDENLTFFQAHDHVQQYARKNFRVVTTNPSLRIIFCSKSPFPVGKGPMRGIGGVYPCFLNSTRHPHH